MPLHKPTFSSLIHNHYSKVVVDKILPTVFSYIYSFMTGVATVLSLFSALSLFSVLNSRLAVFLLSLNLLISTPLAFLAGIYFIYKKRKKGLEVNSHITKFAYHIKKQKAENEVLEKDINQLIRQFEKKYGIAIQDSIPDNNWTKDQIRFYYEAQNYFITTGELIGEKAKVKSKRLILTSATNNLRRFLFDMVLTVGTITFLAPYISLPAAIAQYAFAGAVVIGLAVAFLTYVFVHRRRNAAVKSAAILDRELARQENLHTLLTQIYKSLSECNDKKSKDATPDLDKPVEQTKPAQDAKQAPTNSKATFFTQHRGLYKQGYFRKKLMMIMELTKNYLIEKKMLNINITSDEQVIEVLDHILAENKTEIYRLTAKKLTPFNRNVKTAAQILRLAMRPHHQSTHYGETLSLIEPLSKQARQCSQLRYSKDSGHSVLANSLDEIFQQIKRSDFTLPDIPCNDVTQNSTTEELNEDYTNGYQRFNNIEIACSSSSS